MADIVLKQNGLSFSERKKKRWSLYIRHSFHAWQGRIRLCERRWKIVPLSLSRSLSPPSYGSNLPSLVCTTEWSNSVVWYQSPAYISLSLTQRHTSSSSSSSHQLMVLLSFVEAVCKLQIEFAWMSTSRKGESIPPRRPFPFFLWPRGTGGFLILQCDSKSLGCNIFVQPCEAVKKTSPFSLVNVVLNVTWQWEISPNEKNEKNLKLPVVQGSYVHIS